MDGRNKFGHDDVELLLLKRLRSRSWPRSASFSRRADLAGRLRRSCATSIPRILQDIRYAGSNNFMGRPLAGYDAAECVVKREVGLALKRVQQELAPQKLSLKMLDCYRPARAVHDMVRVGAERPGDAGRAALQSGIQQAGPVPAGLHRRAFRPFHRRCGRSDAGRSERRPFRPLSIPTRPMPIARRP